MCIFPSDGTNRIRFTGQGYQAQSQPDASGPPKTYLFCDNPILAGERGNVKGKIEDVRYKIRDNSLFRIFLSLAAFAVAAQEEEESCADATIDQDVGKICQHPHQKVHKAGAQALQA